MICREVGGDFLVFCQTDHAHFSGELLALWRDPALVAHPRRDDLLFAVRRHDNGWQEADAAPLLHSSGDRPHDFLSIPHTLRLEIWDRGTTRFADERPYVALLITEHAIRLLSPADRASETAEEEFLLRLRLRREKLLEHAAMEEESLARDYPWLQLTDFLSLVICNGWSDPFEIGGVRGRLEDGVLRLSPFPLAGATTFGIACRRLRRRPFDGDTDLAAALATSRWERWSVVVDGA